MGKERHAVDSDDCNSDNENADEVEEEESSEVDPEEEPVEEDPFEEEPVEADPAEEETDEEDPCEEEPDEEDSCEEEPSEEDPCEEEPSEEGSCEEEPDEDPYDESNVESLHEQEPSEVQCEEEPNRLASCEEAVNEDHSCESSKEDEMDVEPFEENTHEEQYEIEVSEDSEPDEEEYEEYEEQCEEESSEEPSEETPSEPREPSGDDRYARQSNPEKNTSADAILGQKVGSLSISLLETPQNMSNNVMVPQKLDNAENTGKKRRSRWDVKAGSNGTADVGIDVSKKKRKSRWSSDDSQLNNKVVVSDHDIAFCQEVVKLHAQLYEITQKLQSREVVDERPDGERSLSPPPIYKNLGIKINLREASLREKLKLHSKEARLREKLKLQRQTIISELIQKNPNYIPPADYKGPKKSKKSRRPMCPSPTPSPTPNSKFYKKLYIPSKEFPEYNFIGLIIGPRGNTQKRMEKETGAKICLRGKGSELEPKGRQRVPKPSDNDDLHVLVEADSQGSLDAAVAMVEKLLIPVEDERNVHKLVQLRELATLNGNLRSKDSINSGKKSCDVCGDATHSSSACPLTASDPGANTNEQDANFLSELRGAFSDFSTPEVPSSCIHSVASVASGSSKPNKEIDNTTLYVGCLPRSVDKKRLVKLFSPFGQICKSRVIRDNKNGPSSSNYGFVQYFDPIKANMAVTQMNGYKIDGKVLVVRITGTRPPHDEPNTGAGGSNQLPQYPGYADTAHSNPGTMCQPCPPGAGGSNQRPQYPGCAATAHSNPGTMCQPCPPGAGGSNQLPQYPGYAATAHSNPGTMCQPCPPGAGGSNQRPQYPGCASTAHSNPGTMCQPCPPGAGGLFNPNQRPQYPGYAATAHSNPGTMCQPCPPGAGGLFNPNQRPQYPAYAATAHSNPGTMCQPCPPGAGGSNQLPQYPGYAATAHSNPGTMCQPCPPGAGGSNQLPQYPGYAATAHSNPGTVCQPCPPGAGGLFNPNQLPQYPGYAATAHSNPGPMCRPCPPGSVLPESAASFVKNSSNSVYHNHFPGQAPSSLGPFCQPPPLSTLLPRDVAPTDELAHFPGYLKSLGPPSQLLQASQTTSLSSSQVHFTPKFSNPYMPPP